MIAATADVQAAAQGDAAAFGRLVAAQQNAVCSIALGILGDVASSEDIAQEVFLTAWQKLDSLQKPESFGPWIRQMTRHKALTRHRGRARREARIQTDDDAVARATEGGEAPLLAAEERRLVREALDALPDDARDVMILFYREGQSVRQVAELLELSEAAVKKRLSRAREAIRADVRGRLEQVLVATAPTTAFTAAVLTALAPLPAAAATSTAIAGGSSGLGSLALPAGASVLLALLGYRVAEQVTRPDRLTDLHRARNLTVLGIVQIPVLTALGGAAGATLAFFVFVSLLGWVQFRILPTAFELPDDRKDDPTARRWERIGRFCGVVGFAAGLFFGLIGLILGMM